MDSATEALAGISYHGAATAARSTQLSTGSQTAIRTDVAVRLKNITDLEPVSQQEFVAELAPCLVLCAGVSMDRDAKKAWYAAAYKALEGIPIALLKRGAAAALAKADHPSKIVPAIMAEIRDDWEWRKRAAKPREIHGVVPEPKRIADNSPLPIDQIRHMTPAMLKMGLAQGWVRQADYDALVPEAAPQTEGE